MRPIIAMLALAAACSLCTSAHAQGGQVGGGFGGQPGGGFGGGMGGQAGGMGGGMAGPGDESDSRSARAVERRIARYLGGEEASSILTPGEYVEWPLTLKAGQVVLAEARSDAFDPALEITDPAGKALAANDDRYPGDQRPLLLWECARDGAYNLRARCFRDKAGGRLYLRSAIADTIDLSSGQMVERTFDKQNRFLLRVPMKAGQVRQVVVEVPDGRRYTRPEAIETVSPTGLPDAHLESGIEGAVPDALVAPVDGVYYVVESMVEGGPRTVRIGTREITPTRAVRAGGAFTLKTANGTPSLLALPVQAGEVLVATASDLPLHTPIALTEAPDFASYDLAKPKANPFFPVAQEADARKESAFTVLPGRARDSRVLVFCARRDATLWLAAQGTGATNDHYTLAVRPAARDLPDAKAASGKLGIGRTDYWAFDAKVGDVMTLQTRTAAFAQQVRVRDPDLKDVWAREAAPDQATVDGSLIVSRPGRYLLAISALGDGGGGDYALSRTVSPPRALAKGQPARGDLDAGRTHVWTLSARPGEPLLVHVRSQGALTWLTRDEQGRAASLPLTWVDQANRYAIVAVPEPTRYLIVLSAAGPRASYAIDLADVPGYVRPK